MENADQVQSFGILFTKDINVFISFGAPQGIPIQSCKRTGSLIRPSLTSFFASQRCPVSKTSISGRIPKLVIFEAIAISIPGVLVIT